MGARVRRLRSLHPLPSPSDSTFTINTSITTDFASSTTITTTIPTLDTPIREVENAICIRQSQSARSLNCPIAAGNPSKSLRASHSEAHEDVSPWAEQRRYRRSTRSNRVRWHDQPEPFPVAFVNVKEQLRQSCIGSRHNSGDAVDQHTNPKRS